MTPAWLLLILTLLDTGLTMFALAFLGAIELNPLYHAIGPVAFWVGKLGFALLFMPVYGLMLRIYNERERALVHGVSCLSCIVLAGVVLWNAAQILIFSYGIGLPH